MRNDEVRTWIGRFAIPRALRIIKGWQLGEASRIRIDFEDQGGAQQYRKALKIDDRRSWALFFSFFSDDEAEKEVEAKLLGSFRFILRGWHRSEVDGLNNPNSIANRTSITRTHLSSIEIFIGWSAAVKCCRWTYCIIHANLNITGHESLFSKVKICCRHPLPGVFIREKVSPRRVRRGERSPNNEQNLTFVVESDLLRSRLCDTYR